MHPQAIRCDLPDTFDKEDRRATDRLDTLTFDCYGTLIDGETGIFEDLRSPSC